MVYNYEGRLQTGRQELHAWPCGSELEEEVNFMGSNVLNLSTSEDVSVEIEVIDPCGGSAGKPIMYPTEAQINKFALEMSQVSIPAVSGMPGWQGVCEREFPLHRVSLRIQRK